MALIDPNDVNAITKIIARYQLIDTARNKGLEWLGKDAETEKLNKEMLRLQVEKQRRELGDIAGPSMGEEHPRIARGLKVAGMGEASRQLRAMDIANQKSMLKPTYKVATIGEELSENLHPEFKWATAVDKDPATLAKILNLTPEVSHGTSSSIARLLRKFVPHG